MYLSLAKLLAVRLLDNDIEVSSIEQLTTSKGSNAIDVLVADALDALRHLD
jgi:hypothetical protein